MYLSAFLVVVCFATFAAATTPVTTATYNNLVRFAHFSSAAYLTCPTVLSASVVNTFNVGSAVGFVALDTTTSQIILSFKGSTSIGDFENDANVLPTSYSSPISGHSCFLCMVHEGFYGTWNSAKSQILPYIQNLHNQHPSFAIIVTGHSLGGALTTFAALGIKGLLGVTPSVYSYGEPRVGYSAYASFVNSQIGTTNLFRGTHTSDSVPQLVPTLLLFQHHSTEYWISADPSGLSTVVQCSGNEDTSCNDGHAGSFSDDLNLFSSNSPHHTYFGVGMGNSCSGV